ncbi:MAG: NADP-dependent malic enzyme [Candidatus Geothermarchaeales archaeon]
MKKQKMETERFGKLAVDYSLFYAGKVEVNPKVPVRDLSDFSIWYTPGVASVSRIIAENEDLSFRYTGRWNTIAVVSDGSRVLGLGDIGPAASMPVMEGKALIYKYLGGVNAVPLPIDAHKPEEIVDMVKKLEPAFGGINLEDIASPKCFYVLDKCREEMQIPVWHDDQQGTAGVTLAGLINALTFTGRKLRGTKILLFGAGAANIATVPVLVAAGADYGDLILVDSKGILHPEREDIDELLLRHPLKYELALKTNKERRKGGSKEAFEDVDVVIGASKPGPGVWKPEWIRSMAEDSIVFALANPVPEMWPEEAKEAGARITATGRSDFANQVNNSLLFPAMFRGVLNVRARTISDKMAVMAAMEIARFAEERGLKEDYIIPTMEEWEFYPRVAAVVAEEAVKEGLARVKMTKDEAYQKSVEIIQKARQTLDLHCREKLILPPPE